MNLIRIHQGNQDAFAQAAIGHAHPLGRPFPADGFKNGAAGQHQIGAVAADTGMGHPPLEGHIEQDAHDIVHFPALEPEPVDLLPLIALKAEMKPGQGRHRARGADQMHGMGADHLAQLFPAAELLEMVGNEAHHGLEDFGRDIDAAEALGKGLAIDPWLENGVLPIRLAAAVGDAALVGELAAGEQFAAVAFAEPGRRYETEAVGTKAEGDRVTGAKTFVLGAPLADTLLVTLAGSKLAKVAKGAAGVVQQDYPVVMGLVILASVATIIGFLISDILYAIIDPRIRFN